MIISKTPLRISFAGGATDLPEFYRRDFGAVLSTTINKYIYIIVHSQFEDKVFLNYRLKYSQSEDVHTIDEIKHPLIREAIRLTNTRKGMEITSLADIPGQTGLGSSSSYTVGLLNALHAYKKESRSPEELARNAAKIEIEILKDPIGKQDHYPAAYGGLNYIQFNKDENVFVKPIICSQKTKEELENNLMLFFTGITRSAKGILTEQNNNTSQNIEFLEKMREQAIRMRDCLHNNSLTEFGEILHQGWEYKKKLASQISNDSIDGYYKKAREAGAIGGKISGAGGGGFLLLYCEKEKQDKIRKTLKNLREIPFKFGSEGSKIIYMEN